MDLLHDVDDLLNWGPKGSLFFCPKLHEIRAPHLSGHLIRTSNRDISEGVQIVASTLQWWYFTFSLHSLQFQSHRPPSIHQLPWPEGKAPFSHRKLRRIWRCGLISTRPHMRHCLPLHHKHSLKWFHYWILFSSKLFHNMLPVCVHVPYKLDFCSHKVFSLCNWLKLHWIVLRTNFCNLLYATELFYLLLFC